MLEHTNLIKSRMTRTEPWYHLFPSGRYHSMSTWEFSSSHFLLLILQSRVK